MTITEPPTTELTAWHPAIGHEVCECGAPAVVVYVTTTGKVPYCGIRNDCSSTEAQRLSAEGMKQFWGHSNRTGEQVVVIPEITVSVQSKRSRDRVLDLAEELRPKLEELHAEALKVRNDSDAVLVALYPILNFEGHLTDEMFELAFKATGFGEVWAACTRITELFGDGLGNGFGTTGLEKHEIARGGERDFPFGTEATVPRSDGLSTIRAVVQWGPSHPRSEGGYVVIDQDTGNHFVCTHEQIKAGLESVPSETPADEVVFS